MSRSLATSPLRPASSLRLLRLAMRTHGGHAGRHRPPGRQRGPWRLADALLFYAGQVARRADHRLPVLRDGRAAPPSEQLDNAVTAAHVLAGLLRDLGLARAWHPSGLADASGWAGMAITELLVHGHDVARALEVELPLPKQVCQRTLTRVFPWVPLELGPPEVALLAVTGRTTVQGVPSDPEWWWQSAPLAEWDGKPCRRTSPPRWL